MLPTRSLSGFLNELQQIERASLPGDAVKILDAFTRHTPFEAGALYLRGRDDAMRLAAKSHQFVAPEILDPQWKQQRSADEPSSITLALRGARDEIGVLTLSAADRMRISRSCARQRSSSARSS